MAKNLVQSKLFFSSKNLEKPIEPIVKNPKSDFDKVTNIIWFYNISMCCLIFNSTDIQIQIQIFISSFTEYKKYYGENKIIHIQ